MSNEKQIALGLMMYTQDNDGKMMYYKYSGLSEMGTLLPYIKSTQVFQCPSNRIDYNSSWDKICKGGSSSMYCTTYGFPAVYDVNAKGAALRNLNFDGKRVTILGQAPTPTKMCLFGETKRSGDIQLGMTRFRADADSLSGFDGKLVPDRHLGGSNYAFFDGHVKWLKKETVMDPPASTLTNQAISFWWHDPK